MKLLFFVFIFLIPSVTHAVMISSKTYNYIWNPFTGTQQYVTSIDTTSINGSGISVSTTASGILLTGSTTYTPCGNSGDVQINFNGTCMGIGGGTTGVLSGNLNFLSVNNGVVLSFATGSLSPGDTNYIQNTLTPTTTTQSFSVKTASSNILNVSSTSTFTGPALFQISPSTSVIIGGLGHIESHQNTPPVISACGGSPSIAGTDMVGIVTTGTLATSCKITFGNPWTNPPVCVGVGSSVAVSLSIATTQTDATVSGVNAGASFFYICSGYK